MRQYLAWLFWGLLLNSSVALASKDKVVLRHVNAWTPALEKALSTTYEVTTASGGTEAALCAKHGALAVLGFSGRDRSQPTVLEVYHCSQATIARRIQLPKKAPRKNAALPETVLLSVREALESIAQPFGLDLGAPAESAPVVTEAPREDVPPARKESTRVHRLRFAAVTRALQRRLTYTDDLFDQFIEHTLPLGPAVGFEALFIPSALQFDGPLQSLGFRASYATVLGVRATDSVRKLSLGASSHDFAVSVVGALSLGNLTMEPDVGFALWTFGFEKPKESVEGFNLASVSYPSLRTGVRLNLRLSDDFSLLGEMHYRHPFGAGDLSSSFFPRARGAGFDVAFGPTWNFHKSFDARLTLDYAHHAFSFNPSPQDSFVAGGALDQAFGASVQLGWNLEI